MTFTDVLAAEVRTGQTILHLGRACEVVGINTTIPHAYLFELAGESANAFYLEDDDVPVAVVEPQVAAP